MMKSSDFSNRLLITHPYGRLLCGYNDTVKNICYLGLDKNLPNKK